MTQSTARPHSTTAIAVLVLALLAWLVPTAAPAATAAQDAVTVIVAPSGGLAAAADALAAAGGHDLESVPSLGLVLGRVPSDAVSGLSGHDAVSSLTMDRTYAAQGQDKAEQDQPSWTASATIGADRAWSEATGEGVGVAVVDTGVVPRLLDESVAIGVDVSGEGTNVDRHGHGTFVSGLVSGDLGIAPDAHLIPVKVADSRGGTSLSAVLLGLAAVLDAPQELNIRVLLLALGRDSDAESDVLELALRQVWASGIVVVVPTGNNGTSVMSPGRDPYLLTVGAIDDQGTAAHDDDTIPSWSIDDADKPDVLAPGVSLVSVRTPGSEIDRANGSARVRGRWFRGSGTSMAAAVTAGAAAVLLQADPSLTPDDVKGRLVASATPAPGGVAAGVVDLPAALASSAGPANTTLPPVEVVVAQDEPTTDGSGWPTWQGTHWAGTHWAATHWAGTHWAGTHWAGTHWAATHWAGTHWAGSHWAGSHWANEGWR